MKDSQTSPSNRLKTATGLLLLIGFAVAVRSSGLLLRLDGALTFHPDAPKQIDALWHFLQGIYLWYRNSLFYDGYPFGLNHVDEFFLRMWLGGWNLLRSWIGLEATPLPERAELFVAVRILRVGYGALTVGLIWCALRVQGVRRGPLWAAAFLAAAAPLSVTVAHMATGDVGVDLFGAGALLCLIAFSRVRRRSLWALCALLIGMAAACKYNGLLLLFLPAAYLLVRLREHSLLQTVGMGLASLLFFALGFFLLTPHLAVNPDEGLKLIWDNFYFIKDYNADADFLALPYLTRVQQSLLKHFPMLLNAFSRTLLLLSVVAAVGVLLRWLAGRMGPRRFGLPPEQAAVFSVVLFAPIAVLTALFTKWNIQPFHLSFLLPFFCFIVGWLGHGLQGPRDRNLLIGLGLLVTLGETGMALQRDLYFWSREDSYLVHHRATQDLIRYSGQREHTKVAEYIWEGPDTLSVFRNRPKALIPPGAEPWENKPNPVTPQIPYRDSGRMVLMDTVRFAREQRLFTVDDEGWTRKTLVYNQRRVDSVRIGIRNGPRPIRLMARSLGDEKLNVDLMPWETRVMDLWIRPDRTEDHPRDPQRTIHLVETAWKSRGGPCSIRLFGAEEPSDSFLWFSGAGPAPAGASSDLQLNRMHFLEGRLESFPRHRRERRLTSVPLPAGAYRFEADLAETQQPWPTALVLHPTELHSNPYRQFIPLTQSEGRLHATFEKALGPQFIDIILAWDASPPDMPSGVWSLQPDGEIMRDRNNQQSTWLKWPDPVEPADPDQPFLRFDVAGTPIRIGMPELHDLAASNSVLTLRPSLEILKPLSQELREYSLFIHMFDEDGQQVRAQDIALSALIADPSYTVPHSLTLPDRPGLYTLTVGCYRPRLRINLPVTPLGTAERHDENRVTFGRIRIPDDLHGR